MHDVGRSVRRPSAIQLRAFADAGRGTVGKSLGSCKEEKPPETSVERTGICTVRSKAAPLDRQLLKDWIPVIMFRLATSPRLAGAASSAARRQFSTSPIAQAAAEVKKLGVIGAGQMVCYSRTVFEEGGSGL